MRWEPPSVVRPGKEKEKESKREIKSTIVPCFFSTWVLRTINQHWAADTSLTRMIENITQCTKKKLVSSKHYERGIYVPQSCQVPWQTNKGTMNGNFYATWDCGERMEEIIAFSILRCKMKHKKCIIKYQLWSRSQKVVHWNFGTFWYSVVMYSAINGRFAQMHLFFTNSAS